MGTNDPDNSLAPALFGKARREVLALLFARPDESFYVREIARVSGAGQGAIQRELSRLARAGVLTRSTRGRHVYFQANPACPIFGELRGIIIKTAGIGDVLREALNPLADRIACAFVYGSVARGEPKQGSDVDVCVIGDVTFAEVVAAVGPCQEKLAREVNPTVYPVAEFQEKLASKHHFVTMLDSTPKLFLIGDEREFAGLGA